MFRLFAASGVGGVAYAAYSYSSATAARDSRAAVEANPTLHGAIRRRDTEKVKEILEMLDADSAAARSTTITAVDDNGASPLVAAARRGEAAMVELLLARGAPLEPLALTAAADGGHPDAARVLFAAGAKIDATTSAGNTIALWRLSGKLPLAAGCS